MDKKNDLIIDNDEGILKLVSDYIQAKGDKFIVIPMEDRIKLFLALVKDNGYNKASFEKLYDFKALFFPDYEMEKLGIKNIDDFLTIFVIGEKETKENKVIILYSKDGIGIDETINENNTQAFEISFKDHTVKQVNLKTLKSNILCDAYTICKCCKFEEKQEETVDYKNLKEAFKEFLTLANDRQA